MDVLNSIINYDKQLLLYIHSKGSLSWDTFWMLATNPLSWSPLVILFFLLGTRAIGLIKTILSTIIIAISGTFSLFIVNLIKNYFKRERPINDNSINHSIRILVEQNDFSFVSGHSTVSFTITFMLFWILKNNYKYTFLLFIFPILFAYSRIYLAVHFPTDILFGMLIGYLIAIVFYKIIHSIVLKK